MMFATTRPPSPSTRPVKGMSEPFASLPHFIAGDPAISPTEKAVLLALLFWCRGKAVCWPSDASIGARVGRCPGTVQRCLRRLQALGLIDRRRVATNPTCRELVLRWRATPATPALDPPAPSARDESEKGEKSRTPRAGRLVTPAAEERKEPDRAELERWASGRDPVLRSIGRAALAELGGRPAEGSFPPSHEDDRPAAPAPTPRSPAERSTAPPTPIHPPRRRRTSYGRPGGVPAWVRALGLDAERGNGPLFRRE